MQVTGWGPTTRIVPGSDGAPLPTNRSTAALQEKGYTVSVAGSGLRVEAAPVDVGRTAAEKAIVLTDLRSADGGLEDLFLALTEDTQREAVEPQMPHTPSAPASDLGGRA